MIFSMSFHTKEDFLADIPSKEGRSIPDPRILLSLQNSKEIDESMIRLADENEHYQNLVIEMQNHFCKILEKKFEEDIKKENEGLTDEELQKEAHAMVTREMSEWLFHKQAASDGSEPITNGQRLRNVFRCYIMYFLQMKEDGKKIVSCKDREDFLISEVEKKKIAQKVFDFLYSPDWRRDVTDTKGNEEHV